MAATTHHTKHQNLCALIETDDTYVLSSGTLFFTYSERLKIITKKLSKKYQKNKMVVQENLFFTLSQIITTPFTHSKAASSKKNWKCCC